MRDRVQGSVFSVAGVDVSVDLQGNTRILRHVLPDTVGDYGHDPILDAHGEPTGFVRLVPSGTVVRIAKP